YVVLNLYLVPPGTKYPLLKLLNHYQTTPPRPPKPPVCPGAPKKPRRQRQQSDDDLVDPTPLSPPPVLQGPEVPWSIQTTCYTVTVEATTREGARVVTRLCL
ncbi:E4, partial [human papillomavirus 69]